MRAFGNALMAKKNKTTGSGAGAMQRLMVILIVLLLILIAGIAAGGAWLYMNGGGQAASSHVAKSTPLPDPVYVPVNAFTVNLSDSRGRVLYIEMSLRVQNKDAATRLQKHMPQVRNRILLVLTSQHADLLMTTQGKQMLAKKVQESVSKPFDSKADPIGVSEVLFTNFIVQ